MTRSNPDYLLYTSHADERFPEVSLRSAHYLVSGNRVALERLRHGHANVHVPFDHAPLEDLIRYAQGDPGLLITWKARCMYTEKAFSPADYDVANPEHLGASWRKHFAAWIKAAAQNSHQKIMLHAVMDFILRAPTWSLDEIVEAFPCFFEEVYDPLIAFSVMSCVFSSQLLYADTGSQTSGKLSCPARFHAAIRLWAKRQYGLNMDRQSDVRILLANALRNRRAGDQLLLNHFLYKAREFVPTDSQRALWSYREWLMSFPPDSASLSIYKRTGLRSALKRERPGYRADRTEPGRSE